MNAIKAREIPIEKVLQNLGCEPTKTIGNDLWFLSPFRPEKTPSFKINRKLNKWFDHGEQVGGNTIDFVIQKFGFNVSESLNYLKNFEEFFSLQKQIFEPIIEKESTNKIDKIIPIQHVALIQYLKSRGIINYKNIPNLTEIHYTINDKKFFALGFKNTSGGFEIRSKYAKICIGAKDVSLIINKTNTIRIFEGFFDYLSFVQKQEFTNDSDFLILNSVALLNRNLVLLQNYTAIEMYFDNDDAGNKYTTIVTERFANAKDSRSVFQGFKDYNEWLIASAVV